MPYHFFAIRTLDPDAGQDALNRFCAANRVVSVERQFVAAGLESHWAVCVTTATGPGPIAGVKGRDRRGLEGAGEKGAGRVDYREVLSDDEFSRFAALRAWRKGVAADEGVPVYAVFTNEQLADIVRRRVDTLAALGEVEGVGPARLDRYGNAVLLQMTVDVPPVAGR